jgi:DnaJ-class molecular chaperone
MLTASKRRCAACDGHGFILVSAHGAQEMQCEDCGGSGEVDNDPDAHCVTTADGGCVSEDPRDMHQPKETRRGR